MTDLSSDQIIGWLKREVAVPGTFDTVFTESSDTDITGALMDGFGKAQLDGWFSGNMLNFDAEQVTPDLSLSGLAIVVTYTGIKWLQNQLANLVTAVKYEAPGPLIFEQQRAATVIAERLKELQAERVMLLERGLNGGGTGTPVFMRDGYAIRVEELYVPEAYRASFQSPLNLL